MLAISFLFLSFIFGYSIVTLLFKNRLRINGKLAFSFIFGTYLTTWLVFLLISFKLTFNYALSISTFILFFLIILNFFQTKKAHFFSLKTKCFEIALLIFSFLASYWLMAKTLGYHNGAIKIGANIWGDMELHLPLTRSFSWGENFPPESPFFPHKNLAYHFLFDFAVAILEYLGMRIDIAFNLLGALSLTALLLLIFNFSQILFKKNYLLGIISILLFLFNSSLGFLDAFRKIDAANFLDLGKKIWTNKQYLSINPFQKDLVSICWNLNVYVNQRHLIFSIGLALVLLSWFLQLLKRSKLSYQTFILLGIFWGMMPFWYTHIFISLGLIFSFFLIVNKIQRKAIFLTLIVGSLIAIPQILWITKDVQSSFAFQPGFLASKPLTLASFSSYWFYNLGLSIFTIIFGFLIATREQKKFFLSFSLIFLIGNLFRFNKEMFNNHKFFNFWFILANLYTAYFLLFLLKTSFKTKILAFILLFFLTLSGVIDFMVIKNEFYFFVPDSPKNQLMFWVKNNTPPKTTFLIINDEMYHPVRMAGRKTYQGWPRYAWAYGYDIKTRKEQVKNFFKIKNASLLRTKLLENDIDYIMIPSQIPENMEIQIDYPFWQKNFKRVYKNQRMQVFAVL